MPICAIVSMSLCLQDAGIRVNLARDLSSRAELAHYLDRVAAGQPNVAYVRPEVEALLARWAMIRDVLAGEEAVKLHDLVTLESGAPSLTTDLYYRYLPQPNPSVQDAANIERYRQYIERAVFYPVTGRTHDGLVGQAFLRKPVIELPVGLEYLADDCDGAGVGIEAQARKSLGQNLGFGFGGLLTDYPPVPPGMTKAQQEAMNIRPAILLYEPEQVINWRTKVIGSKRVLVMVVLAESYETSDDGFEIKTAPQWRRLLLDDTGGYVVELYRQATVDGKAEFQMVPGYPVIPLNSSGQRFAHIPYHPFGAINNDPEPDPAPMYQHAALNVAHYRCSADYFESAYYNGQTTAAVFGITDDWWKDVLKGKLNLGARGGIPLPPGGGIDGYQPGPNTLSYEAMQHIELQMASLGAKLIEQKAVNITATEARQNHASEISVLGTCAVNIASVYTMAINDAAEFVGAEQTGKFEIDPEFELGSLTAQELQQVVACWKDKAISTSEMRDKLAKAGLATLSIDDFQSEMDEEKPETAPEPVAPIVVPDNEEQAPVGDEGQPEGGA